MKVQGGVLGIIAMHAPHNMKPLAERFQFFTELDEEFRGCSVNVGKFIFGDLKSRVGHQLPGEDLMELCEGNGLLIANSFIPGAAEEKLPL